MLAVQKLAIDTAATPRTGALLVTRSNSSLEAWSVWRHQLARVWLGRGLSRTWPDCC